MLKRISKRAEGLQPQLSRNSSIKADAQPAPAVAMDLRQVVWSVDWMLNGISLQSVYAERVPQPFTTPHAKAVAAGEKARRFTSQGPGSREQRVALHWPAELFRGTSLTVQPGDRLSVLTKASYVSSEAEKPVRSSGSKTTEVITGRLTPRLSFFGSKKKPAPFEPAGPASDVKSLGKRFFTRDIVVQVPERVEVGALATRATDAGVCYTHADYHSYVVTFRQIPSLAEQMKNTGAGKAAIALLEEEMAADSDGEGKPTFAVESLTVVIPTDHLLVEFRRNIAPRDPSGGNSEFDSGSAAGAGFGSHNRIAFEMVRNLDTGEIIHVSEVAERVPRGVGPEAMHWLLHEEERAARLVIPFLSSTADVVKCAPPLPLLSLHGTAESGASVRPVITLDRYSHGVTDMRLTSLVITLATWRRFSHYGASEQQPILGSETSRPALTGAAARRGGGGIGRSLLSADIDSTIAVTCTLTSSNQGGIGTVASAFSALVAISPALRDAVSAALVLEQSAFEVSLDEGFTAAAKLARLSGAAAAATLTEARLHQPSHGEDEDGGISPSPSASQLSDGAASSEAGGRPARPQPARSKKESMRLSLGGGGKGLGGRLGGADKPAERKLGWPRRGSSAQAAAEHGSAPSELRGCSLQVSRLSVHLVQSRVRHRLGHFDRRSANKYSPEPEPEVIFEADENDGTRCRFTLQLTGKLYGLVAPSAWHRDVIQLVIARRAQQAAAAAAASAHAGSAAARGDAAGCLPLLYEPPGVQCEGAPLGVDVPLVGDLLELAAARVDYADGCAVQWWRRHHTGALVPIRGAVGPKYRVSAEDAYCHLEAVCTPFRAAAESADGEQALSGSSARLLGQRQRRNSSEAGGGLIWGVPSVSAVHAAVAPTEAQEEAVRSAHSWEYAKLTVLCAPLGGGIPPLEVQARSLPAQTASALAAAGCLGGADDGLPLPQGAAAHAHAHAPSRRGSVVSGGPPLEAYTCMLSKKEVCVRQSGVLVLSNLLSWHVKSGLAVRIPLWDKPLVELLEDELDARAGRLFISFDSLEERDQFVLTFHYLVYHGLHVQYHAQAAGASLARR